MRYTLVLLSLLLWPSVAQAKYVGCKYDGNPQVINGQIRQALLCVGNSGETDQPTVVYGLSKAGIDQQADAFLSALNQSITEAAKVVGGQTAPKPVPPVIVPPSADDIAQDLFVRDVRKLRVAWELLIETGLIPADDPEFVAFLKKVQSERPTDLLKSF